MLRRLSVAAGPFPDIAEHMPVQPPDGVTAKKANRLSHYA